MDALAPADQRKARRMRDGLGLPDDRTLLAYVLRWLVVAHRTAWLSQPLDRGLRFWLDNVAV